MDAGEPSYTTGDTLHTERAFTSNLGVFFAVFFLIIVLSYGSYIYRRSIRSQSLPIISLDDSVHSDDDDSTGLDDDVLGTFPTILYSEVAMLLNGETKSATHADNCGSAGCSICLADYKPADVIRLLPECSHLFHVSCVDTWLRVHPTCPVCRNSPFPTQRI